MMTLLTLRALGAFEVSLQATTVTAFPTDKIRALLIYLALENDQPHRRERLAAFFWPEIAQRDAMNNLRVTLHRLREALDKTQPGVGATLIDSTRQTIQIRSALVTADVAAFEALLRACAAHAHANRHHCADCRDRLAAAVQLYRGELLAGFGLADAPAFEEWLLLRRETLHQQALAALHTLVQAYEQQGDDEQAHHYASRQLLLDPSREEAHRQLIRSLARRGLRTEALAQYETCRRLLREQLAVDPDPETVALVEQIRAGQLDTRQETRRHETRETRPVEEARMPSASPVSLSPVSLSAQDWGEAPAVGKVYGRQAEVASVTGWLVQEPGALRARMVALLGIGGVGKTTLAATVVRTVAPHFDRVLWRSLLNAPPLDELLRDILQRLADERLYDFPPNLDGQLALLLDFLRRQRTLFVLDNLESILQPAHSGQMRAGYEGYAQLLRLVAERSHQSCLLLTSRERPHGLEQWAEDSPLVRTLALEGLTAAAGHSMLTARGLSGPVADATALVERYSGNPLALKLVAQTVQELFGGDISAFLAVEAPIFDEMRTLLDQQFARLAPLEQELLLWLAIEREPVALQSLRANLVTLESPRVLLEALRTLQRRSLISQNTQGFLLQNVITEYLTDLLVAQLYQEITAEFDIRDAESAALNRYALLKATAKAYVRASQVRLIVQPILTQLLAHLGRSGLVTQIAAILGQLRVLSPALRGYAAGNLLNLLLHAGIDVTGYDFAGLPIWQADLQGKLLPDVNLRGADLTHSVFTHTFGEIKDIQFDAEDNLLVAAVVEGQLRLWRAREAAEAGQLVHEYQSFGADATRGDFSADGAILASGHTDHCIRLWDVQQGHLLQTLAGHTEIPWSVVFSPSNGRLASGTADGKVYVWDRAAGQITHTFHGHTAPLPALAFAADEQLLASGDVDGGVCVWRIGETVPLYRLQGHTDEVHSLVFAGHWLITSSHDRSIRVWDLTNGQTIRTLQAHTLPLRALAVSADGTMLASSGDDLFACLWDVRTGQLRHTLIDPSYHNVYLRFSADGHRLAIVRADQSIALWDVESGQRLDLLAAHSNFVFSVVFSPDGKFVASGGADCIIRLWEAADRDRIAPVRLLLGHTLWINALAFSPDGKTLASTGNERHIRLWDLQTGHVRQILEGHTNVVECLQFSADGKRLVSGSRDKTLRVWAIGPTPDLPPHAEQQVLYLLQGHTERVRACAFSPDGRWVASGSMDRTVRLWDLTKGGQAVHLLTGHTNGVRCLAFSPDGRLVASGSYDQTLRLWDVASGALLNVWSFQKTLVFAVAFHPAGELLATGEGDNQVSLWEIGSGRLLARLHGHSNSIETIGFSPDGRWLVSGSYDETIKLWDVAAALAGQAACRQSWRSPGPYAGMNITGMTGISAAQRAALKTLGAVEDDADRETGRQGDRERNESAPTEPMVPQSSADPATLPQPPPVTTIPPHNLPTPLTLFVGRTEEVAAILQQLADPTVRLLTLLGAGGMGKTRLAVEAAKRILDFGLTISDSATGQVALQSKIQNLKFPDGRFFVALASIRQTSELAIAVAAAVGLNLTGGDPQQMVIRFLQPKCLLLILDNFEHLLVANAPGQVSREPSAVQFVADLLQAAPAVKILVTSREKLNLQSEQLYAIHGMELAAAATLSSAEAATAVQLFVQSARRVQPGFALTTKNLPALMRICRLVEGMPLGLEMAAAWVEMLTLEEIAGEIDKSLDFLAVDWPELPARQRRMRGVFEWSWHLLNETERQVLRQLALFRGGFTRTAAEQVAGASLRVLTSLMQKSLLRRSASSGEANPVRYELHELLRQFAAEQLAAQPGEQAAVAQRHSTFYLALVAACERRLARNELKEAAGEIQSELDNVRQAWLWAVHHDAWSVLSAAAYALRLFYTFTSLEPEGEQLFQLAIERLRRFTAPPSQRLRSKLLGFQTILQIAQLKHQEAMAAAQEAMAIAAALPADQRDGEGETFGALALGMVLSLKSPGQEARTRLEQALTLAQQHQSALAPGQAPIESLYDADWAARISLRDLDRYADNYPGAVAHIQQAVQLCRSLGKTRGEMVCLIHLADPLIKVHDYAAAQQACAQGLALARTLHNRWGEAFSLHHLGNATRLLGYYGEARRLLESAYTIIQADSDLAQEAMVAAVLGHLHTLMGAGDQARTWFDRFLALLQQFHEPWDEAEIEGMLRLALFYLQREDSVQALRYATRGLQIAQRYGWRQNQAQALILCGQAQMGLQQLAAAVTSYEQALALCQELQDAYLGAEAQAALAQLALQQGDLSQAQHLVATILPVLARHPQAGLDEPFAIYLTCYRVLAAAADPRAIPILQQGYALLQQYASQIDDDTLRRSFLEHVPVHQALQQAYRHG